MPRFLFVFAFLVLCIALLCWLPRVSAHDTFYPHHREDFEDITRRRELRGTVVLITIAFVGVVGTMVYMALRKSSPEDRREEIALKVVQERLECAARAAARAARQVLTTRSNIEEAATSALTTYAETCGISWRRHSYRAVNTDSVPYQIRCTIGNDVVTLVINASTVQIKADHYFSKSGFDSERMSKGASVTAVLKIRGEKEEWSLK